MSEHCIEHLCSLWGEDTSLESNLNISQFTNIHLSLFPKQRQKRSGLHSQAMNNEIQKTIEIEYRGVQMQILTKNIEFASLYFKFFGIFLRLH